MSQLAPGLRGFGGAGASGGFGGGVDDDAGDGFGGG